MTSPEKRALLEAYERVLESNAERRERELAAEKARRAPRRRRIRLALTLIVGVAGAAMLVVQPSWFISPAPPPESPAVREASARIALYVTTQHISRFRERTGRLPRTLTELHSTVPDGLTYKRADPDYALALQTGDGLHLSYASSEPVAKLLGDSFKVLAAGRTR